MHTASDGKNFTNLPPMKAHEASLRKPKMEHPMPHEAGMEHEMATCPSCGHQFDPKEEMKEEQVHPGIHEQIGGEHGGY